MANLDYLIVGQGLAGSVLALLMRRRGLSFLVVDNGNPAAASRVAAGIMNTVTGRKLVKSWRVDELFPPAFSFYREAERELGETWLERRVVERFLITEREREIWRLKKDDPEMEGHLAPLPPSRPAAFRSPVDGFALTGGGILDAPAFVAAVGHCLSREGRLMQNDLPVEALRPSKRGVDWGEVRARRVIFCEGHRASRNPYFSWLPFRHAKGETLTLRWHDGGQDRIFNCGKWLVPLGDGRARAGSTFEWKALTETPTEAGRMEILEGLSGMLRMPPEILEHKAGVRPVLRDGRPVLGVHPGMPGLAIFNGLGAKGVGLAPFFAEQLLDHLENGSPLDPEVDVRRNL